MPSFALKAPPPADTAPLHFHEKSMWRGNAVQPGDDIFLFAAEHQGGHGLYARATVTHARRGEGSRVHLTVTPVAAPKQPLGRADLRPYRTQPGTPGAELDHKLYRQATNKVAGLTPEAAAFLQALF